MTTRPPAHAASNTPDQPHTAQSSETGRVGVVDEGLDSVEDAVQAEGEWVDRRRGAGECIRQCGKVFDMAVDEFDGEPLPLLRVVGVEVGVLLGEVARVSGDEQEDLVALDSLQTVDSSAASAASIQWSRCGPRS